MFEAALTEAKLLKSIIEAIKDIITDANFEISNAGIELQAMDNAHVALVALRLDAEGFEHFRCDRTFSLGVSILPLGMILKTASNDDKITLRAEENSDTLTVLIEAKSGDRVSEFSVKQMDLNAETLGIPDAEYDASVTMPANQFQRIVRDLTTFGEGLAVSVVKDAIKFHTTGDHGTANITCKQSSNVDGSDAVRVEMINPVSQKYSGKYFVTFSKAAPLSTNVVISMSKDMPVMLHYKAEGVGHVRYYLAPKMEDDEMQEE